MFLSNTVKRYLCFGLLGVRLGVSPVGMVELFVHGASLTT